MHTVVVRVWLPDRPGALGQVASRIGAVKGDVLNIEVLESGGGRVVDELVVALDDLELVDLMVNEVHAIDGVSVEHVRAIPEHHIDGGVLALTAAAELGEAAGDDPAGDLVEAVHRITDSEWTLLARGTDTVRTFGEPPTTKWVHSYIAGCRHLDDPHAAANDVFWTDLPSCGLWVAAGRPERPIHVRERVRLDLFARIADQLLADTLRA